MKKRQQQQAMRESNGFTLVELMIIVFIIAVMATVAIPNIINWLPTMRTKAAARDLYSALQRAKSDAVRTNTTITFTFTTGCDNAGTYTFSNPPTGTVNITGTMSNGICLGTATAYPTGVLSTTLPAGVPGRIDINNPSATNSYFITQTVAGVFRLQ